TVSETMSFRTLAPAWRILAQSLNISKNFPSLGIRCLNIRLPGAACPTRRRGKVEKNGRVPNPAPPPESPGDPCFRGESFRPGNTICPEKMPLRGEFGNPRPPL